MEVHHCLCHDIISRKNRKWLLVALGIAENLMARSSRNCKKLYGMAAQMTTFYISPPVATQSSFAALILLGVST